MITTPTAERADKVIAAPAETRTANRTTGEEMPITSPASFKPRFDQRQERAEDTARQLIYAWAEHGISRESHIEPAAMPSAILAEVAAGAQWAAAEKIRGWANVLAEAFGDAPEHIRAAFIQCTEGVFPASPKHCKPLTDRLRSFHIDRRKREIAERISKAIQHGDDTEGLLAELATLEAAAPVGISDLLAARAFDFRTQPPRPVPIFKLANLPLCTPGNITNIQAAPKAGKSAVVDAMIAAVMNGNRQGPDTLNFSAENPHGLALVHIDTEQSRFDADSLVRRAIRRAHVTEPPPWFYSYSLADLGIRERRDALRHVMDECTRKHGGIFAVLIDGIGDLCADPNDSEESFELVHELHALAIRNDCTIATVLHENPGSETGKTRGHLGSQLERKAETNLRLAKDKDGVTTVWAERARHCYLPKEHGPCFAWDDEAKMHASCGTAGQIKQAANREKMTAEAGRVFNDCPPLRHTDAVEAVMDFLELKEKSAKERIRKWNVEGIIEKDSNGKYNLKKS